ncbi:MAG: hypothetical protein JST58_17635 [Bacteroidetes bacterium]|nr:hypothetical protein [Bacteroidota bacterium]
MVDGIQICYHDCARSHLLEADWQALFWDKSLVRVDDNRLMKFRGLDLKLKNSKNGGLALLVSGSIHKYHNLGEHNADQFTFERLVQSIDSFTDLFSIPAKECYIHGIEVGLNLILEYPVIRVLKNVVCHAYKPFSFLSERSIRNGIVCTHSKYRVKVYDKSKVSGVSCGNTLRFEVAIDKMEKIAAYQIKTLADLQDKYKVYPLINLLKDALNDIVFTDSSMNIRILSEHEQKQFLHFSNPKTWQTLSKHQRCRAKKTFKKLLANGNPPNLFPIVIKTWDNLFREKIEADLPQPLDNGCFKMEALETATFGQLEYTGQKLRKEFGKSIEINAGFLINENLNIIDKELAEKPENRFCISCGKSLGTTNPKRKFCSPKKYGNKAAKRCRNKQSNKKRDFKRLIQKAIAKDLYLVISYKENGCVYSDILHNSEFMTVKETWDRIEKVCLLEK